MPNDTPSRRRGGSARAVGGRTRKKQRIVLMVGLPGSGKSTYLERLGVTPLSSDAVRQLLADDATDQTIHKRVFATIRYLLRQRLAIGRAVTYVDATHLTLEICIARNSGRERVVPAEAMRKMAAKLAPPKAAEGFSRVTVVR